MSLRPKPFDLPPSRGYHDALGLLRSKGIDLYVNLDAVARTPMLQELTGQERTDAVMRISAMNGELDSAYEQIHAGLSINPYGIRVENNPASLANVFVGDVPGQTLEERSVVFWRQMDVKLNTAVLTKPEEHHVAFGARAHIASELCAHILSHVWQDPKIKGYYLSLLYYYAAMEQLAIGVKSNTYAFTTMIKTGTVPDLDIMRNIRPVIVAGDIQEMERIFGDSLLRGLGVSPIISAGDDENGAAYFTSN